PLVALDANIGQSFNIGNPEIVILLVVGFQRTPYIFLGQCVLMLHHLQIIKSLFNILPELLLRHTAFLSIDSKAQQQAKQMTTPFHSLPELLLRHTAFGSIDSKAHQKEIPMPALYLSDLPQPPMVERIRIITMHLSGNIPLLASFLASHNNTLIPLRICLPRLSSCHFGWAERLIDIHPVFWLCVGVQIIQRYPFSGTESDQLRPMLVIDAAHHAEALIDG